MLDFKFPANMDMFARDIGFTLGADTRVAEVDAEKANILAMFKTDEGRAKFEVGFARGRDTLKFVESLGKNQDSKPILH